VPVAPAALFVLRVARHDSSPHGLPPYCALYARVELWTLDEFDEDVVPESISKLNERARIPLFTCSTQDPYSSEL